MQGNAGHDCDLGQKGGSNLHGPEPPGVAVDLQTGPVVLTNLMTQLIARRRVEHVEIEIRSTALNRTTLINDPRKY